MNRQVAGTRSWRLLVSAARDIVIDVTRMSLADRALASLATLIVLWLHIGMASQVAEALPGAAKWTAYGVWLVGASLKDRSFARKLATTAWPLVALGAYSAAAAAWGAPGAERFVYGFGYLLITCSLFLYYCRSEVRAARRALVSLLLLDVAVMSVVTWFALSRDAGISRKLATGGQIRRTLLGDDTHYGVGGYGFAYSIGAISVALAFCVLFSRRRRWVCASLLLVSLILLAKTSYAIAVIITGVVMCGLLIRALSQARGWRVAAAATSVAMVAASAFVIAIVNNLIDLSRFSPALDTRFEELARVLSGDGLQGTGISARLDLYGRSVMTFWRDPWLGAAASPSSDLVTGGHSEWLDAAAEFGLLSMLLLLFLSRAHRTTMAGVAPVARPLVNAVWAYFLILGLVNPLLFSDILLTWFFLVPLAADVWLYRRRCSQQIRAGSGKPRVLLVHHSAQIGGGTRSLLDVVEMLRSEYSVSVCAPSDPPGLARQVRERGVGFVPMTLAAPLYNHYNGGSAVFSRTFLAGRIRSARHRRAWLRLIESEAPDVVIMNSAVLAPLGQVAREAGAVPLCMVRETFPPRRWSLRTRLLYRMLDGNFDAVVFLSDWDERAAALRVASTAVVRDCVRHEAVEVIDRGEAAEEIGVPASTFNVLFMGGASHIKGLEVALGALRSLSAPDIRLIVAGDMAAVTLPPTNGLSFRRLVDPAPGRWAESVTNLLGDPKVLTRLVVVGETMDTAACYSAADVVLFPSTSPHQARPVFEAGAYGLPVIISQFNETAELVADGENGLTFPAGDPEQLAARISLLHEDRELSTTLGLRNFERSRTEHSFDTERARLLGLLNTMLSSSRSAAEAPIEGSPR